MYSFRKGDYEDDVIAKKNGFIYHANGKNRLPSCIYQRISTE